MTSHLNDLADEIRRIPDTLATLSGDPAHRRGYVEDLAQRVEQVAAEPDGDKLEVAGLLDIEQQIRADALAAAARVLAPALSNMSWPSIHAHRDAIAHLWVELAWHGDGWIRTGQRPS